MPGGIRPPLDTILSWPTPNYVDPETKSKAVLIIACVFGPLTLGLFIGRLWVRLKIQKNAGWDDWLMIVAMVPVMALTVILPLITEVYHTNKHIWDVKPRYFVTQRKFLLVIETVFSFATGLIKISILLFFRRLSSRSVTPSFRHATWISIGFIATSSIAFTLVPIFGCQPISAFWEQVDWEKRTHGYKFSCFNEGADVTAAGIISAIQDLITAVLPTFLYWNLQVPLRQKIALFGIFAFGYVGVAIGAARAYLCWYAFFGTYDVTWAAWDTSLFTLLELHIGTTCANAPALKVFFKHYFSLEKLSTARSKSRSNPNFSGGTIVGTTKSAPEFDGKNIWQRLTNRKSTRFILEPRTDVAVEIHGGLQIQKDITITQSAVPRRNSCADTLDSTDSLTGDRADRDIEMGSLRTRDSSMSRDERMQALPAIPSPSLIRNPFSAISNSSAEPPK